MPIRPELRHFYAGDWRRYRLAVIAAHGTKCSRCGRDVPKYLNFCHLSHDPRNVVRIAPMCASCHSRNDAKQRFAMTRRTWARRRGQLWLLPEIEFAPYPDSFWPRRAIADLQLALF
jgi:hypothetical protein